MALWQANWGFRLALDRALSDLDITAPQFSALLMIGAYPDLSSADLARLSLLTPQTINVIVRNLEGAGDDRPAPASGFTGAILALEITPEGRRILRKQCRARADKVARSRLNWRAGFGTEKEEEAVRRWLVYVATTLRRYKTKGTNTASMISEKTPAARRILRMRARGSQPRSIRSLLPAPPPARTWANTSRFVNKGYSRRPTGLRRSARRRSVYNSTCPCPVSIGRRRWGFAFNVQWAALQQLCSECTRPCAPVINY